MGELQGSDKSPSLSRALVSDRSDIPLQQRASTLDLWQGTMWLVNSLRQSRATPEVTDIFPDEADTDSLAKRLGIGENEVSEALVDLKGDRSGTLLVESNDSIPHISAVPIPHGMTAKRADRKFRTADLREERFLERRILHEDDLKERNGTELSRMSLRKYFDSFSLISSSFLFLILQLPDEANAKD